MIKFYQFVAYFFESVSELFYFYLNYFKSRNFDFDFEIHFYQQLVVDQLNEEQNDLVKDLIDLIASRLQATMSNELNRIKEIIINDEQQQEEKANNNEIIYVINSFLSFFFFFLLFVYLFFLIVVQKKAKILPKLNRKFSFKIFFLLFLDFKIQAINFKINCNNRCV